jgi:hypothetical protein
MSRPCSGMARLIRSAGPAAANHSHVDTTTDPALLSGARKLPNRSDFDFRIHLWRNSFVGLTS